MKKDEMFDDVKKQINRQNIEPKEALFNTLKKCVEIKDSPKKVEKNFYVRIDNIPFDSVEYIAYLCRTFNVKFALVALSKNYDYDGKPIFVNHPYLHIY